MNEKIVGFSADIKLFRLLFDRRDDSPDELQTLFAFGGKLYSGIP